MGIGHCRSRTSHPLRGCQNVRRATSGRRAGSSVTVFIGTGSVIPIDARMGAVSRPGTVALLVFATVAVTIASGAWAQPQPPTADSLAPTLERDSVLMRVDVTDTGDAQWQIEYRTRLDDPNTSQAFQSLRQDVANNPDAYSQTFFDGIRSTIASAENATGREMQGTNFSVHAEVHHLPQRYGVVVYTFTWRGFAAVDGNRLRVGDALAGFFLGENERLLLSWPSTYELDDVHPPASERRDRAVVWTGPLEFGPNEPRVVVVAPSSGVEWPTRWFATAILVGVALAAGVVGWLGRRNSDNTTMSASDSEASTTLLSNEEQVIRVLETNGGRIRQQEVVDELDWTEAKTSRVISTLRDQGRVESFRLGRENVLALPDRDE